MGPRASHGIIYTKPYKTIDDQLDLLATRGMEIADRGAAAACLERLGYYRLSGYWHPFRESRVSTNPLTGQALLDSRTGKQQIVVLDNFRPGTTFELVVSLYSFDKLLRLLILDAIGEIEVALRVDIALLIGARDPWAHLNPDALHGNFSKKVDSKTNKSEHSIWVEILENKFERSREEFIKHFKSKYNGEQPPIWIAIELWDFGMLSKFLSGMKFSDRESIAKKYKMPRADLLTSWVRNINNVRNICAHHSRLWNTSPADQTSPPKFGEIPELDHVAADRTSQTRVYATACALQFLLKTIRPESSWGKRLKDLCDRFPVSPAVSLAQAGFSSGWREQSLWN